MEFSNNTNDIVDKGEEKEVIESMDIQNDSKCSEDLIDLLNRFKELHTRVIEMRLQMDELRGKVTRRDRVESIVDELRELPRLFSGADALSIDEEGWRSIMEGGSVIGAYIRSDQRKKLADEANKAGAVASTGEVSGGGGAVYSLEEIRNMDRTTIRQNLDKVLSSLEAVKG